MQLDAPFRVVTNTVEADVLPILARADSEFTVYELRDLGVDRSPEGIRLCLNRLVDQGIVRRRTIGRATAYSLNRSHLAADALIELANLGTTFRQRVRQLISEWKVQPAYAAIFGSAARGGMRPDSDIDVVIVRDADPTQEWDEQVASFQRTVSGWTGNDVRCLEYDIEEIRGASSREPVIRDILLDAVTIAGRERSFAEWVSG